MENPGKYRNDPGNLGQAQHLCVAGLLNEIRQDRIAQGPQDSLFRIVVA